LANTIIQIKRSDVINTPANGALYDGELFYTFTGDKLFIGNTTGTGVIEIGGKYFVNRLNTVSNLANSTNITVRSAYNRANAAYDTAVGAFFAANAAITDYSPAFHQANNANITAIAAFAKANAAANVSILDDGALVTNAPISINFTGPGVTLANVGNAVTVTIPADAIANVSSVGPVYPVAGSLWWHDLIGRLLIRVDDGSSVQWVDASPGSPGAQGPIGAQGPFGPKSATISYPTASEDLTLLYTRQTVIINKISSIISKTMPSNVAFTIKYAPNRSDAGTEVVAGGLYCTSNTIANVVTSFTNATLPTNNFVWLETSAITGSVQEFHLTIDFA